jgi:EF-hand domain pair
MSAPQHYYTGMPGQPTPSAPPLPAASGYGEPPPGGAHQEMPPQPPPQQQYGHAPPYGQPPPPPPPPMQQHGGYAPQHSGYGYAQPLSPGVFAPQYPPPPQQYFPYGAVQHGYPPQAPGTYGYSPQPPHEQAHPPPPGFAASQLGYDVDSAARHAFMSADTDRSGTLDPREFMNVLQGMGVQVTYLDALALFARVDRDQNGGITIDEFVSLHRDLHAKQMVGRPSPPHAAPGQHHGRSGLPGHYGSSPGMPPHDVNLQLPGQHPQHLQQYSQQYPQQQQAPYSPHPPPM